MVLVQEKYVNHIGLGFFASLFWCPHLLDFGVFFSFGLLCWGNERQAYL